jgi:acetyl-CoA C-acetyltransferase
MNEAVLVSAVRTPIAKVKGALKDLPPAEYGALVIQEALKRAKVQGEEVNDVIFGNCLSGGGNMARLVALTAGMPITTPGLTIDRQCGSGINSVALAAEAIVAGSGSIMVAGGVESMTRMPFLMEVSSQAYDRKPPKFVSRELSPASVGKLGRTLPNQSGGAGRVFLPEPAKNEGGDGDGDLLRADRSGCHPGEKGGDPSLRHG